MQIHIQIGAKPMSEAYQPQPTSLPIRSCQKTTPVVQSTRKQEQYRDIGVKNYLEITFRLPLFCLK